MARLIRRYANRKLYDVEGRRYVTLDELGDRVGRGEEVQVLDQRTSEDLTSLTLAQMLLDAVRDKAAHVPRPVLVRLVRLARGPASAWGRWVSPQEAASRARAEVERVVGGLLAKGRLSLEEGLALRQDLARSVHGIVAEAQSGAERVKHLFTSLGKPGSAPRAKRRGPRRARKQSSR